MRPPSRAEAPKSVGIWIRVSTEDQVKGESPEHHERRARLYAESKNWKVIEVYSLEAVSGKSVMHLPEAQRMLEDVRAGRITGLIFSKLARLARNTKELLEFSEIFRSCNADLISLQESIDTSSPAGRLFYTMIAAMAQWEREEIADRVAASVPIRAKLGKPLGGAAPFGYRWQDRELVPDSKEAPIRRLLYELFREHRRKKTVARLLNDAGHRTRNGGAFTDTTVERLIRDPTAKGTRRANYTRSTGDKKHWVMKPENEWVLSPVEPIVESALWEECNALLNERRVTRKPPTRKPVHLFAGFVECQCGTKMYVPSNTPKYVCYACRNKIPVTDLETIFHEQLRTFVFSPTDFMAFLEQSDEVLSQKQALVASLEAETATVRKEMEKVYRLYVSDQITPDGFGRTYGPLESRLTQLEDEIPRMLGEIDFLKIQALSRDEILAETRDLHSRWPDLTSDEKRRIIETITDRILIDKNEVTIELAYLPVPSEIMTTEQRGHRGSSRQRG